MWRLLNVIVTVSILIPCESRINSQVNYQHQDFLPPKHKRTPEQIQSDGYPMETHNVLTKDGYNINMHRIPYSNKFPRTQNHSNKVIFIPHCLFCSSLIWIMMGDRKSLAYMLSDSGYDVWLMNGRGTTYTNHTIYPSTSSKYWNFSFDEMGTIDAPTSLDYVLEKTKMKQVDVLSFSMGTTMLFVMLSKLPEYNLKVRRYVALAPVTFVTEVPAPISAIAPIENLIESVTRDLRIYSAPPDGWKINELISGVCHRRDHISLKLCKQFLYTFLGQTLSDLPRGSLGQYLTSIPDTTSMKLVAHYAQMANSGNFEEYDFGVRGNLRHYQSRSPPLYNLSQVSTSVALFSSDADFLSTSKNVKRLRIALPNVERHYRITAPKFGHMHFVWGKKADKILYEHIINYLMS